MPLAKTEKNSTASATANVAYVDRLVANIAARLECQVRLIRNATDPVAMLEVLRPILVHPGVNRGEIPPFFFHVAEDEVRRRQTAKAVHLNHHTETQH